MRADAHESFLRLSEALTGFSRLDLLGTGLAETFLHSMIDIVGDAVVGELLLTGDRILRNPRLDEAAVAAALSKEVVGNVRLGPLAKNLIRMWYVGNWEQLPASWGDLYGAPANDQTKVVSAAAYQEGLVWRMIGSHAPGAKQPGYGTWAVRPREEIG